MVKMSRIYPTCYPVGMMGECPRGEAPVGYTRSGTCWMPWGEPGWYPVCDHPHRWADRDEDEHRDEHRDEHKKKRKDHGSPAECCTDFNLPEKERGSCDDAGLTPYSGRCDDYMGSRCVWNRDALCDAYRTDAPRVWPRYSYRRPYRPYSPYDYYRYGQPTICDRDPMYCAWMRGWY